MYIPNMPRTNPAENTFKLCSHGAFTSHAMPLSREDDNNLDTVSGECAKHGHLLHAKKTPPWHAQHKRKSAYAIQ